MTVQKDWIPILCRFFPLPTVWTWAVKPPNEPHDSLLPVAWVLFAVLERFPQTLRAAGSPWPWLCCGFPRRRSPFFCPTGSPVWTACRHDHLWMPPPVRKWRKYFLENLLLSVLWELLICSGWTSCLEHEFSSSTPETLFCQKYSHLQTGLFSFSSPNRRRPSPFCPGDDMIRLTRHFHSYYCSHVTECYCFNNAGGLRDCFKAFLGHWPWGCASWKLRCSGRVCWGRRWEIWCWLWVLPSPQDSSCGYLNKNPIKSE